MVIVAPFRIQDSVYRQKAYTLAKRFACRKATLSFRRAKRLCAEVYSFEYKEEKQILSTVVTFSW
jgi:hypothetical protein